MSRGEMSGRCVVWVGRPSVEEHFGLLRAGWRTLVADPAAQGETLPECGEAAIAVVDLRASAVAAVAILRELRESHPGMAWIGLTGARTPAHEPAVRHALPQAIELIDGVSTFSALRQALQRVPADAPQPVDDRPTVLTGDSPAIRTLSQNIR